MTTTSWHPPPPPPSSEAPRGPDVPVAPGRVKAGWLLRVLAVLLDSAVVASVAWLATSDAPELATLPLLTSPDPIAQDAVAWTAGTLLGLGVLQAYTGMTPGKRVTGISVVDAGSGRPIGLLGTVLRWFAHLLDAFLMIGYLRPAWHPQGRTFADSLLGTVVVRATRPAPHPWMMWFRNIRDTRAPRLRWSPRITGAVALVLCAAAAAMSLAQGGGGSSRTATTSCTSTGQIEATAMIGNEVTTRWESRLGIRRGGFEAGRVAVGWSDGLGLDASGNPAVDGATAAVTVQGPDGRTYSSPGVTSDGFLDDGLDDGSGDGLDDAEDPWWSVPDTLASTGLETTEDVTGWTATTTLLDDDGGLLAECSASVPAVETAGQES